MISRSLSEPILATYVVKESYYLQNLEQYLAV